MADWYKYDNCREYIACIVRFTFPSFFVDAALIPVSKNVHFQMRSFKIDISFRLEEGSAYNQLARYNEVITNRSQTQGNVDVFRSQT